ncbi:hypothetical protein B0T19DRAFT_399583 [Cercophora scortea]|uniref:Uncharacterized protein n=1 Tax=Cercophora scortea TaxID=314031 RepID=A0AAE0IZY4_9PEZI|nr:hypothetical protein B0T19DRAFT_399583 [Cercophora scortea]
MATRRWSAGCLARSLAATQLARLQIPATSTPLPVSSVLVVPQANSRQSNTHFCVHYCVQHGVARLLGPVGWGWAAAAAAAAAGDIKSGLGLKRDGGCFWHPVSSVHMHVMGAPAVVAGTVVVVAVVVAVFTGSYRQLDGQLSFSEADPD